MNPQFAQSPQEALKMLPSIVQPDDVVLVQGAGNVNQISQYLAQHALGDSSANSGVKNDVADSGGSRGR